MEDYVQNKNNKYAKELALLDRLRLAGFAVRSWRASPQS
jgi:hypothetical protein